MSVRGDTWRLVCWMTRYLLCGDVGMVISERWLSISGTWQKVNTKTMLFYIHPVIWFVPSIGGIIQLLLNVGFTLNKALNIIKTLNCMHAPTCYRPCAKPSEESMILISYIINLNEEHVKRLQLVVIDSIPQALLAGLYTSIWRVMEMLLYFISRSYNKFYLKSRISLFMFPKISRIVLAATQLLRNSRVSFNVCVRIYFECFFALQRKSVYIFF